MSRPIASVIIPAFNRAGSVRAAVESVLAQGIADIEVLVVDDASSDATRDVVGGIDDARVRLIARTRNGGAAAARNSGIGAARGTLIAFLDSDDVWLPGKLDCQLSALARASSDAAVSCTGVEMHLLDLGLVRVQPLEDTLDWARRLAMDCNLSPGSTQASRREVFDTIGPFDETLLRFEDWDWLVRYTRRGRITVVREPCARVFNRRGRLGDHVEAAAHRFLAKHAAVFAELTPADRRKAEADLWLQVTGTYAFEGRVIAALPAIGAALRQRPWNTLYRLAAGATGLARGRSRVGHVPVADMPVVHAPTS